MAQGQKSRRFVLPGDPTHNVWHLPANLNEQVLSILTKQVCRKLSGGKKDLNISEQFATLECGSKSDLLFDSMVANFGSPSHGSMVLHDAR